MADVKTKTQVAVDEIAVTKCWDRSVKKPVIDAARKAMEKALKGSNAVELVKSVGRKDKGLGVNMTFPEVSYDARKKTVTVTMTPMVTKYPGPRMATGAGAPAKIAANGIEEKAAAKEAALLAGDLVASQAAKVRKIVEALGKTL
jgi:hypothetical protein